MSRTFAESVEATSLSTSWVPVLAIRKAATLNGRTPSPRTYYKGFTALGGADIELRVSFGATVQAGGSWSAPTDVPASETSIEVQATPTVTATGIVIDREYLSSALRAQSRVEASNQMELGNNTEVVLWARAFAGTPTLTAAMLKWEERW